MAEDRMLNDEILLGLIKANGGGGGGGTTNYNLLSNKPQIAGTELQGNKSLADLGIASASDLAAKQNALTAGDYIDITNDEISVNREIPSVIAEYEIKTEPMVEGQAFISVTKTVNGEVVLTQKYGSSTAGINQGINFDENIYVDYSKTASWSWTYKLRNASVDHAANYTQSWNYGSTVDYTEEFVVTDHSGDKLVIKSEMDTALAGKQDTLTFDNVPTDGSNNPVKSNGIYDSEKDIYATMGKMGAKNVIPYPYTDTTKTTNGITYTDNGDGTITANGTALDTANFILADEFTFTENESYILTGCPSGGSANTYRQYIITYGGDVGEGKRITPTSESGLTKQILIQVVAGTTVSNLTFKPMLRLASDTDDTYQPYAKTNKQLTDDVALLDSGKADTDMVAADFNAGTSYTVGNYCVQDGKLYKFKNNHSGAWSSADVDEVKVTGELSALKSGLTTCIKNGDYPRFAGINIGPSEDGARIYSENGDINFRTGFNENFSYTSVRSIVNNMIFDVWIPANEFDPLTQCNGFYCYSVNPGLKIYQGVPNNYSEYATVFGCSGVTYKILMYVDLFGSFAVWSQMNNEWISYRSV